MLKREKKKKKSVILGFVKAKIEKRKKKKTVKREKGEEKSEI